MVLSLALQASIWIMRRVVGEGPQVGPDYCSRDSPRTEADERTVPQRVDLDHDRLYGCRRERASLTFIDEERKRGRSQFRDSSLSRRCLSRKRRLPH